MSDQTIALWGMFFRLFQIRFWFEGECLEDIHTQKILRKRMMFHGLDRVEWLPLHEAPWSISNNILKWCGTRPISKWWMHNNMRSLWMGVPVITRGTHYVSRMSTAVLAGAQLNDWLQIQWMIILQKQRSSAAVALSETNAAWRHRCSTHPWVTRRFDECIGGIQAMAQRHATVISCETVLG